MEHISEKEREQVKEIINYLLSRNFLLKELEREKYFWTLKNKEYIKEYLKVIGWELVIDDRHGCIAIFSPSHEHRIRLKKDETIWLLILRLIYEEKRRSLSISQYPVTSLFEIKGKYAAFRIDFVNKTRLRDLIQLGKHYQLLMPASNDFESDDCRFQLFHSFLHVLNTEELTVLEEKIRAYDESGDSVEVDAEAAAN